MGVEKQEHEQNVEIQSNAVNVAGQRSSESLLLGPKPNLFNDKEVYISNELHLHFSSR